MKTDPKTVKPKNFLHVAFLVAIFLFAASTLSQASLYSTQGVGPSLLSASLAPSGSPPIIISASLDPLKVRPGDSMLVTAQISGPSGVSSVYADMGGIETISLSSGTAYAGILQAGGCNYG